MYTLREEQAPDGYLIAEDVKFTVKDTGKVQKVKMKDAHPYGKLVIKKTDSTSKAALSGAEFELREKESGEVVEKLVTDKTGCKLFTICPFSRITFIYFPNSPML